MPGRCACGNVAFTVVYTPDERGRIVRRELCDECCQRWLDEHEVVEDVGGD
jgi:hypothetical protein